MTFPCRSIALCLSLITLSLSHAAPACATLGEGPDSIAKDRKALKTVRRATVTQPSYTVEESTSNAATVREFLSSSGVVFAVAWDGMVHPDLATLLGSYNAEFETAQQASRRRGQKRARIQGERVVVETWGHMRHVQGRAYLPSLVPTGVNIDEIK